MKSKKTAKEILKKLPKRYWKNGQRDIAAVTLSVAAVQSLKQTHQTQQGITTFNWNIYCHKSSINIHVDINNFP